MKRKILPPGKKKKTPFGGNCEPPKNPPQKKTNPLPLLCPFLAPQPHGVFFKNPKSQGLKFPSGGFFYGQSKRDSKAKGIAQEIKIKISVGFFFSVRIKFLPGYIIDRK